MPMSSKLLSNCNQQVSFNFCIHVKSTAKSSPLEYNALGYRGHPIYIPTTLHSSAWVHFPHSFHSIRTSAGHTALHLCSTRSAHLLQTSSTNVFLEIASFPSAPQLQISPLRLARAMSLRDCRQVASRHANAVQYTQPRQCGKGGMNLCSGG